MANDIKAVFGEHGNIYYTHHKKGDLQDMRDVLAMRAVNRECLAYLTPECMRPFTLKFEYHLADPWSPDEKQIRAMVRVLHLSRDDRWHMFVDANSRRYVQRVDVLRIAKVLHLGIRADDGDSEQNHVRMRFRCWFPEKKVACRLSPNDPIRMCPTDLYTEIFDTPYPWPAYVSTKFDCVEGNASLKIDIKGMF